MKIIIEALSFKFGVGLYRFYVAIGCYWSDGWLGLVVVLFTATQNIKIVRNHLNNNMIIAMAKNMMKSLQNIEFLGHFQMDVRENFWMPKDFATKLFTREISNNYIKNTCN